MLCAGPDVESSGGLDPAALQAIEDEAEDDRKMMMDRHSSNRFADMAEQVEEFDQELQRFEDGDDQPDTSERDAGGSKGKSEGTGLMAEEIERLKEEERAGGDGSGLETFLLVAPHASHIPAALFPR